ncbi:hypothetical protein JCM17961_00490 [Endothiovibrio diazotrophicus]
MEGRDDHPHPGQAIGSWRKHFQAVESAPLLPGIVVEEAHHPSTALLEPPSGEPPALPGAEDGKRAPILRIEQEIPDIGQ